MPDIDVIPTFRREQIHRQDLQDLSIAMRTVRDWVASNSSVPGQPPPGPEDTRGKAFDIFPALVQEDPSSNPDGTMYTPDGIRCKVSRGSTLEGLATGDVYSARDIIPSVFNEVVWASNLANTPLVALFNQAVVVQPGDTLGVPNIVAGSGGGPMPPPGKIVLCISLPNVGTAPADYPPPPGADFEGGPNPQVATPAQPMYVFWWSEGAEVVASTLDAPSAMDPSGIYYSAVTDVGQATGMPPEGMTSDTADTVLLNGAEQGLVNGPGATYANSHWLPTAEQFTNAYPSQIVGNDTDFAPPRPMAFTCAPNPFATFVVALTPYSMTGDGNATTPPTYQYVCKDLWGNTLSAQATPTSRPYPGNGSFAVASWGLAHYDENGDFQLLIPFEIPNTATCP